MSENVEWLGRLTGVEAVADGYALALEGANGAAAVHVPEGGVEALRATIDDLATSDGGGGDV